MVAIATAARILSSWGLNVRAISWPQISAGSFKGVEEKEGYEKEPLHRPVSYPTYLVILKSPRSGSTFMAKVLATNERVFEKFEPSISAARRHFESCLDLGNAHYLTQWTCSVSLNDYLQDPKKSPQKDTRYKDINALITRFNATVAIQLRANLIEKAVSAFKRWPGPARGKPPPVVAKHIVQRALEGRETMRAFANAEKFMPADEPPLWMWYEDVVRSCGESFAALYRRLGLPEELPELCASTKFRNDTFDADYGGHLRSELLKHEVLAPMNDSVAFDLAVNTSDIYNKLRRETENISEVMLGYWR